MRQDDTKSMCPDLNYQKNVFTQLNEDPVETPQKLKYLCVRVDIHTRKIVVTIDVIDN